MTRLYNELADVYHEMYIVLFHYKKVFNFLDKILKKNKCQNILEIGCGSAPLSKKFMKKGYKYAAIDLSKEMLKIAHNENPNAKLIQSDMRNFKVKNKVDAVLCLGRPFTYMTTNSDVMGALNSSNKALKKNGLLIFDNFDAEFIMKNFQSKFVQKVKTKNKNYKRINTHKLNLKTGFTWNINETYYIKQNNKTKIEKDKSTLRSFTKQEIKVFLIMNGFKILKQIQSNFLKEPFSFYTIAQKIK